MTHPRAPRRLPLSPLALWALLLGAAGLGCFGLGCSGPSAPQDAGADAGADAGSPVDAGTDAGGDAGTDGGFECLTDEDCPSPDAPRCDPDTRACVDRCVTGSCARFAADGRGACGSAGVCVECGAEEASACAAGATCDLLTETCAGAPAASVDICEACTNDDQCLPDHRCVLSRYLGEPQGYFCMKRQRTGCERPFFVSARDRNSINGAAPESYCGPSEERTTCAAMLAVDQPCGAGCPVGGRCETVAGSGMVCTYDCASDLECPATALNIGTCGETEPFCGGA